MRNVEIDVSKQVLARYYNYDRDYAPVVGPKAAASVEKTVYRTIQSELDELRFERRSILMFLVNE
jgi:hypothetical protein